MDQRLAVLHRRGHEGAPLNDEVFTHFKWWNVNKCEHTVCRNPETRRAPYLGVT